MMQFCEMPCSDESYQQIYESFQGLKHPLILTPGDNDWRDCSDPLGRLASLRSRFFSTSRSLGKTTIPLTRQSAPYVENARWTKGNVVFATLNVPGLLVRSVATAPDGRSLTFLANSTPDHRTPFEERWAGWFVTGSPGGLRHLGNATIADAHLPTAAATPATSPLATMQGRFDATGYLSPHSDVAAHLVFAHQMHMVNLLTRVGWQTRVARADQGAEAARATAAALAGDFVDYLLFVDEPRLPAPVKGASGFAERFRLRCVNCGRVRNVGHGTARCVGVSAILAPAAVTRRRSSWPTNAPSAMHSRASWAANISAALK